MKVVEYWHGTIKNYRYDGDVSLSKANDSIVDLKLKLETQEKMLPETRAHEQTVIKELADEKKLLQDSATSHNELVAVMKLWTSRLMDVAERLTAQLFAMGMSSFRFSHEVNVTDSARLTLFFEHVLDALKLLYSNRVAYLAEESRKLCWGALTKVLTKVAYWNPSVDLSKALDSMLEGVDL